MYANFLNNVLKFKKELKVNKNQVKGKNKTKALKKSADALPKKNKTLKNTKKMPIRKSGRRRKEGNKNKFSRKIKRNVVRLLQQSKNGKTKREKLDGNNSKIKKIIILKSLITREALKEKKIKNIKSNLGFFFNFRLQRCLYFLCIIVFNLI